MEKKKNHKITYVLVVIAILMIAGGFLSQKQNAKDAMINGMVDDTETVLSGSEEGRKKVYPEITDMTDVFTVILQGVTKENIAGYALDDAFLMWLLGEYGEDTLMQLAWHVLDREMDIDTWYELTGESMHVLWLRYCEENNFQKYYLENVKWYDCSSEDEVVISFTGDFNFAEDWYTMEAFGARSGLEECITTEIAQIMKDSDVLFMNNEFVYSDCTDALPRKAYTFRANEDRVELLKELGADIVSLANNHTYDFGAEGILDTMQVLNEAEIAFVGAGKDIEDAQKIVYAVANGRKIAFVAATEIERSIQYTKEATADTPGVLKTLNAEKFIRVIERAKATSDYVIALPHWGTEGTLYSDGSQQRQAKLYEQAGADVILGGHPHRLQGVEFYHDTPVAYSLGNFWFSDGTLYTTLAQVRIQADGELILRFLPCEQKDLTTSLITDTTEKDAFYHYLSMISTNVVMDEDGNVYNKKELNEEQYANYPYDSATSESPVIGGVDNDGYDIDIVGNRIQ